MRDLTALIWNQAKHICAISRLNNEWADIIRGHIRHVCGGINASIIATLEAMADHKQRRTGSKYTTLQQEGGDPQTMIDLWHKPHDAPVPYPTRYHSVTELCMFLLQKGALWYICLMHCGICEVKVSW